MSLELRIGSAKLSILARLHRRIRVPTAIGCYLCLVLIPLLSDSLVALLQSAERQRHFMVRCQTRLQLRHELVVVIGGIRQRLDILCGTAMLAQVGDVLRVRPQLSLDGDEPLLIAAGLQHLVIHLGIERAAAGCLNGAVEPDAALKVMAPPHLPPTAPPARVGAGVRRHLTRNHRAGRGGPAEGPRPRGKPPHAESTSPCLSRRARAETSVSIGLRQGPPLRREPRYLSLRWRCIPPGRTERQKRKGRCKRPRSKSKRERERERSGAAIHRRQKKKDTATEKRRSMEKEDKCRAAPVELQDMNACAFSQLSGYCPTHFQQSICPGNRLLSQLAQEKKRDLGILFFCILLVDRLHI